MPYLELPVQAVPLIKVTDMTEIGQHTSHLLRLADEERTRLLDGLLRLADDKVQVADDMLVRVIDRVARRWRR